MSTQRSCFLILLEVFGDPLSGRRQDCLQRVFRVGNSETSTKGVREKFFESVLFQICFEFEDRNNKLIVCLLLADFLSCKLVL